MSTPQSIRLARFPKKGKLNGKNIAAGKGARSEVSVRADDSLNRTSGVNAGCVDERTKVFERMMRESAVTARKAMKLQAEEERESTTSA